MLKEYLLPFLKEVETTDLSEYKIENLSLPDFDSLFVSFVFKKYSVTDSMDMQMVWTSYSKAFKECKMGKMKSAAFNYAKAEKMFNHKNFSDIQRQYLKVYIYPNLAYYEYRNGNYERSVELLHKAISNIKFIENEYPDAHLMIIQQVHNLARVYFKLQKYEDFKQCITDVLGYLMFSEVSQDNEFGFAPEVLNHCDSTLKYLFINQILSETVYFCLVYDPNIEIYTDIVEPLKNYNEDNYISRWLKFIVALHNKEQLSKDILVPDYSYLSLKVMAYHIMMDLDYCNDRHVKDQIRENLKFYYSIPEFHILRDRISVNN